VELRGFDEERIKSMSNGVARILKTHDQFNNKIEVRILDINDQLLQHVKREYCSDGKHIVRHLFIKKNHSKSKYEN
jgi:hypothetical protein